MKQFCFAFTIARNARGFQVAASSFRLHFGVTLSCISPVLSSDSKNTLSHCSGQLLPSSRCLLRTLLPNNQNTKKTTTKQHQTIRKVLLPLVSNPLDFFYCMSPWVKIPRTYLPTRSGDAALPNLCSRFLQLSLLGLQLFLQLLLPKAAWQRLQLPVSLQRHSEHCSTGREIMWTWIQVLGLD